GARAPRGRGDARLRSPDPLCGRRGRLPCSRARAARGPVRPRIAVAAVALSEAEVPRAAALIARAFDEDPVLVHMLPYRPRRAQLGPLHVEPVVRMCVRHGSAWRTESFDAVAAWMPPDGWPPDPALIAEFGF